MSLLDTVTKGRRPRRVHPTNRGYRKRDSAAALGTASKRRLCFSRTKII